MTARFTTSDAVFRYRAFISYSHRDEQWAGWLHRGLERYRVPPRLIGQRTVVGEVPARLAPVFRDREELPTATDLGRVVKDALEQSAALIVICSPEAAQSRWVNEEVRTFQRLGRNERVFCLIVSGDPAGKSAPLCFPPALLRAAEDSPSQEHEVSIEPVAADVRPGKDGRNSALLKIIAGLLGVGLDELTRREQQRRQRRLVAITAASVAGMGVTSVLAMLALMASNEAERQRARAEIEAKTSQQTTEFLVQLFEVADPSETRGNSVTAREILDRGAMRIDRELRDQPEVRANLIYTMGRVYTGLGLYSSATDLLRRALEIRAQVSREPTRESVETANALGAALYWKGEYSAADEVYRAALAAARELGSDADSLVSEAMNGIADLLVQNGDFTGAEAQYRAALEIDRLLHADAHPDVARSLGGLAAALLYQERFAESESALRESLAIRRQALGDDHPLVAESLNDLASMLYFSGQAEPAEPIFREVLGRYRFIYGSEHVVVSSILNNLGRILLERGELTEAEQLLSEALTIDRRLHDAGHDDFVFTLNNLGLVRLGLGQIDAALPLFEEARAIAATHHHRMLAQIWSNLADVYSRSGRIEDATHAIDAARPLLESEYADDAWHLANLASIEGAVAVTEGRLDLAEPLLLESYEVIAERWTERGLFTRLAAARVGQLYAARGDGEQAERYERVAAGR
jgi:tetratricopeptide (TPR) repeat protein